MHEDYTVSCQPYIIINIFVMWYILSCGLSGACWGLVRQMCNVYFGLVWRTSDSSHMTNVGHMGDVYYIQLPSMQLLWPTLVYWHKHTRIHARTHIRTHTHTTCAQSYTCTHTHSICTRARMHAHARIHTHCVVIFLINTGPQIKLHLCLINNSFLLMEILTLS